MNMFRMKKYIIIGSVALVAIGTALFVKQVFFSRPFCKDCNVILISLDTLSANHLPCYGYERNTAPNLCKFGQDNIMFTNMYANASWTLPSHVSIFTGLYPIQHKIFGADNYLSHNVAFLPEILQKNGYKTYFSMTLHNAHLPLNTVYNRGIDQLEEGDTPSTWKNSLDALSENNKKGQKTFLFLHTYWVHDPYIPKSEKETVYAGKNLSNSSYLKIYQNSTGPNKCTSNFLNYFKESLKEDLRGNLEVQKPIYKIIYPELIKVSDEKSASMFCHTYEDSRYLEDYYYGYARSLVGTLISVNKNTTSHLINLYDSKIVELDKLLSGVFSYIQNSELKKNTIIIVTADHGEEFMEHGQWTHGVNLYDTTVKVPLMMYIPGQNNKKIMQPAQSVDIVPTLLNVLRIKNSYTFAGSDLFGNTNKTKYVAAQLDSLYGTIRDNEWKLFYQMKDGVPVGVELYNYKKDPQEKNDVIFTNPAIVEKLLKNIPK